MPVIEHRTHSAEFSAHGSSVPGSRLSRIARLAIAALNRPVVSVEDAGRAAVRCTACKIGWQRWWPKMRSVSGGVCPTRHELNHSEQHHRTLLSSFPRIKPMRYCAGGRADLRDCGGSEMLICNAVSAIILATLLPPPTFKGAIWRPSAAQRSEWREFGGAPGI